MTTENMALAALIVAIGAFSVAMATAVLDLWVWVQVSRICRKMREEIEQ